MVEVLLFLAAAYLLGSIPFGYLLVRLRGKDDIRKQGSGNIGAANVLRNHGWRIALATLALDLAKGAVPVLVGTRLFEDPAWAVVGGTLAIAGHIYPPMLKFSGGKGVATFVGAIAATHFPAALIFAVVFFAVLHGSRYVSAASLTAGTAAFLAILFSQVAEVSMVFCLAMVLIAVRHRANIQRLATDTELQFHWRFHG